MPVSEDELDHRVHSSLSQNNEYRYPGLSKAEQRKNNKPIMEKKRRARINQCLNELKTLILDATNKDPARHTKLEKADILEMTVKHLQSVQRQHLSAAVASDPTVIHKFKIGFDECASEVSRYIGNLEGIENGVKQRLVSHLSNCITGLQPLSLPSSISNTIAVASHETRTANSEDIVNNNDVTRFQTVPGLQLIPSRLPSGELALLLPNSSTLSSLFPNTLDFTSRPHISAFTPVSKDTIPPLSGSSAVQEFPRTAYESSQSEVSSTSNDGTSFKAPGTPMKSHSNVGTFSTSSLLIPVTELNPEYKVSQLGVTLPERSNILKPLTVYTDPCFDLTSHSKNSPQTTKSPLDFSIKKESAEIPSSTNNFTKKRPLEDLPCNIQIPSKLIKLNSEKKQKYDSEKYHVLAARSTVNETISNSDMWRPW